MSRTPLFLAALASSAVPGLDPTTVEAVVPRPGDEYEIAYVTDAQDRKWVIKAPATQAAGAALDEVSTLYTLLARRLDVAVPTVRGSVGVPEGRAVVYLRATGSPITFVALPAGSLAADIGRVLAHVHNLPRELFDEAGRVSYDAPTHRQRLLSDLDRAAASGHVPTGLLGRWEAVLDDVSLWRFATTPVHGRFTGENVLAAFEDPDDASSGKVRAVLGWEAARIGDPADDLATIVAEADDATIDSFTEAYLNSRVERADRWLLTRARLAGEMRHVHRLLTHLSAGNGALVEKAAASLRRLDEQVWDSEPLHTPAVAGSPSREGQAHEENDGPDAAGPGSAPRSPGAGAVPLAPGHAPVAAPDEELATRGVAMGHYLSDGPDGGQGGSADEGELTRAISADLLFGDDEAADGADTRGGRDAMDTHAADGADARGGRAAMDSDATDTDTPGTDTPATDTPDTADAQVNDTAHDSTHDTTDDAADDHGAAGAAAPYADDVDADGADDGDAVLDTGEGASEFVALRPAPRQQPPR